MSDAGYGSGQGYPKKIAIFGTGTGPMNTNDQITKLVPALKLCSSCGRTCDPGGGVQKTPEKWVCGKCWRILLQGGKPKKAAVV